MPVQLIGIINAKQAITKFGREKNLHFIGSPADILTLRFFFDITFEPVLFKYKLSEFFNEKIIKSVTTGL